MVSTPIFTLKASKQVVAPLILRLALTDEGAEELAGTGAGGARDPIDELDIPQQLVHCRLPLTELDQLRPEGIGRLLTGPQYVDHSKLVPRNGRAN